MGADRECKPMMLYNWTYATRTSFMNGENMLFNHWIFDYKQFRNRNVAHSIMPQIRRKIGLLGYSRI